EECIGSDCIPVCLSCHAAFIANPPNSGSGIAEEDNFRFHVLNQLEGYWPLVVCRSINAPSLIGATIVPRASIGSIKPHLENRPIVRKDLLQLISIIFNVSGTSVLCVIPIPG